MRQSGGNLRRHCLLPPPIARPGSLALLRASSTFPVAAPRSPMSALTEEQARTYMHKLLAAMAAAGGSDLFIANDFPPSMKVDGGMKPMTTQKLTADVTRALANAMMTERQREEFAREMECNFAVAIPGTGRFRINILVQQQSVSLVC